VCECARFPAAHLTWFLFLCLFPSVRACVCLFSLSFLLSPSLSLSPSAVRALSFLLSLCTHIEEHVYLQRLALLCKLPVGNFACFRGSTVQRMKREEAKPLPNLAAPHHARAEGYHHIRNSSDSGGGAGCRRNFDAQVLMIFCRERARQGEHAHVRVCVCMCITERTRERKRKSGHARARDHERTRGYGSKQETSLQFTALVLQNVPRQRNAHIFQQNWKFTKDEAKLAHNS